MGTNILDHYESSARSKALAKHVKAFKQRGGKIKKIKPGVITDKGDKPKRIGK